MTLTRLFSAGRPLLAFPSLSLMVLCGPLCTPAAAEDKKAREPQPAEFASKIEPVLKRFCYDCHGGGSAKWDVSLDDAKKGARHLGNRGLWLRIWKNLRIDHMPPADEDQPKASERKEVVHWIERNVFMLDPANPDPGRAPIRRLNRAQYRHAIEDLLGVDYDVQNNFPPDDTGYGFDTIGEVLSISPLMMEKYLAAARQIMAEAIPEEGKKNAESYRRIFAEDPLPKAPDRRDQPARTILERFASRAYRRPVDADTVDKLVELAKANGAGDGDQFDAGIRFALTAILSSPQFILRNDVPTKNGEGVVPIDDYSLASRLSFFLWNSTPDEALLELASKAKLRYNVRSTIDRMLKDPKSERFVKSFVGQWLQTRNIDGKLFDTTHILGINDLNKAVRIFNLYTRQDMQRETEMFFGHIVRENRPAVELITADYSFVNDRLAKYYGVKDFEGKAFRKVSLKGNRRLGGILTHGSFLIATSNPTRTSPVKRGLFVLENILGTPPPPPPPNVPDLAEARKEVGGASTMRERLK
ncbi:MAG: DUF1592 domain-containing protein, partial [Planctomycetota bacterium]|nr:DUF1592 domain-containing protein [Planctomycetota bacterium]